MSPRPVTHCYVAISIRLFGEEGGCDGVGYVPVPNDTTAGVCVCVSTLV